MWLRRVERQRNLAPQCGQDREFSMCTLRCCLSSGRALNALEQKEHEYESAASSAVVGGGEEARSRWRGRCREPGMMLHTARWCGERTRAPSATGRERAEVVCSGTKRSVRSPTV